MNKFLKGAGKAVAWITASAAGLSLIGAVLYGAWSGVGSLMTLMKDRKVAELEEKLKTANDTVATLTKSNGILRQQNEVATTFIDAVQAEPTEIVLDKGQPHLESPGSAIIQLLEVNGNQARVLLNRHNPVTVDKGVPLEFSGIVGSKCTITVLEAYSERQAAKLRIKCIPVSM